LTGERLRPSIFCPAVTVFSDDSEVRQNIGAVCDYKVRLWPVNLRLGTSNYQIFEPDMMRVPLSFACLLVLISGEVLVQQVRAQARPDTVTVSLSEAVNRALDVSPDIHQREAEQSYAEAREDFARSNRYFTEFNLTTGHSVVPGLTDSSEPSDRVYLDPTLRNDWEEWKPFNMAQVTLTQPIHTFGQLNRSIEAAERGVEVENARVDQKELEVSFRTAEIYFNVLLTEELFRLAEQTRSVIDRAKEEIQRMLDEGAEDVDDADMFQVQLTEQEYRKRLAEITEQREIARSALKRQLFLPDTATLRPVRRSLEPLAFELDTLTRYITMGLNRRPEVEQARAGLAAREALVEVARSNYYPKLFVRGSAGIRYTPDRPRQPNPYISDQLRGQSLEAGIGFRQNLNFLQTRANVEQARAERNEVRAQREGAQQLIRFEVEEAYRKLKIARSALEAQEEALSISKDWLGTEQVNFEFDLGDTENLVKAVRASLEQEVAYYRAVHDYNTAVLRLLRATGVLTDRLSGGGLVDYQ
jgi:outer membrane protein TolC